MNIIHSMTVRARHGRSLRLGQCLARLEAIRADADCLGLCVYPQAGDRLSWRVEGRWRSCAARDAFLAGEQLRQVLAQAFSEDLVASLHCGMERLRRVA